MTDGPTLPPFKYILDDDNNSVSVEDVLEWAQWYEAAFTSRRLLVARDEVNGEVLSTVFLAVRQFELGLDDPPILFETALFHADGSMEITGRWATWDQAAHGHALSLKVLRATPGMAR